MKETYDKAMAAVLRDEGGYSNDAGDPGGPTKYGITIHDVRMYLKPNATANDVKNLTLDQAKVIYEKHYADPIHYNDLPAGVDYAIFDYGINSGIGRAAHVLQKLVGAKVDGSIGPETIKLTNKMDPVKLINAIYDERLAFLRALPTWHIFGKGWGTRCKNGRILALSMVGIKPAPMHPAVAATVAATMVTGGAAVGAGTSNHIWVWLGIAVVLVIGLISYLVYEGKKHVADSNVPTNPV